MLAPDLILLRYFAYPSRHSNLSHHWRCLISFRVFIYPVAHHFVVILPISPSCTHSMLYLCFNSSFICLDGSHIFIITLSNLALNIYAFGLSPHPAVKPGIHELGFSLHILTPLSSGAYLHVLMNVNANSNYEMSVTRHCRKYNCFVNGFFNDAIIAM